MRRAQCASSAGQPPGQIIDGLSIRDRPTDVEDRATPGHWEWDLITGSQYTHMVILVERSSRFTMLVKVPGKDTASMLTALSTQIRQLPSSFAPVLTWDRGMELAQHERLTLDSNVQVYLLSRPPNSAQFITRHSRLSFSPQPNPARTEP